MIWVFLAIALAAVALVAVLSLRVWRQIKGLGREVGSATQRLDRAQAELGRLQAAGPLAPPPVCTCGAAE